MKKIKLFLILSVALTISTSSFAGGKYGIRAGYQLSNIYNSGLTMNPRNIDAFYVGMFAEQRIVPMLWFGSGSEYSQMGSGYGTGNKTLMHYISIPTYLKLKIGPVYAIAGASASFKVYEKHYYADSPQDPFQNAGWFDIPVYAGLGLQIAVLRIEARYSWGTIDLYKEPMTGYKTQGFQLGLGIAF